MKLRTAITIITSRLLRKMLRLLKKGGTNLPGTVALKICPKIIGELSRGVTVILVTGTNGKTTITRMIEQMLIEADLPYFTNKSGANMDTGIATEFINNSTLLGKCKYPYALIECDELAFKYVSKYADISYVVVSNVFRDQLDRYGEITHTVTGIFDGIRNIPNATVCLNADCSLSTSLKDRIPNKVIFYGVNCPIYKEKVEEVSDAPYCIKCGSEYEYSYITYGHLGAYRCEKCGYCRPLPTVAVTEITDFDADSSTVKMDFGGEMCEIKINLPAGYNIYNAAAATTVGYAMGLKKEVTKTALQTFSCGFGRMEKFSVNDTDMRMILVKNPAGANQVLSFLYNIKEPSVFVMGLNDRYADGTDISWIWDADFERLAALDDKLKEVVVTGIRRDDMAMRFKYAGVPTEKIKEIDNFEEVIEYVTSKPYPAFIMPTYTAMLEIREIMSRKYGYKEFWK